jgi:hypothetical protein
VGGVNPLGRLELSVLIMLCWGLPLTWLTLRLFRVSDDEHLIAGSFLAFAYGLLATPLLRWLVP